MWEESLSATIGPNVHPLSGRSGGGGGAHDVPGWCGGALRVGEVENAGHGLHAEGVIVHVHGCEAGRVRLLIRRPRDGWLDGVKDL